MKKLINKYKLSKNSYIIICLLFIILIFIYATLLVIDSNIDIKCYHLKLQ